MSDNWMDYLSIFSFLLTLVGFIVTIQQIRKTRSAVQAATEATEQARDESRLAYQKFATAHAHRFVNEAKIHLENEAWDKAAVRLSDLADQVAQLAVIDGQWRTIVDELRQWASVCNRMSAGDLKRFPKTKWIAFCVRLEARIDNFLGPFTERAAEERNDLSE